MFYQEAFHKLSQVDSLVTIGERHQRNLAATFEKPIQQIHFCLHSNANECFKWGCLFLYGYL